DDAADVVLRKISTEADAVDDLLIQRVGELVHLAFELLAGGRAGVLLVCAFILADLDVVRLDADLVEQSLGEHGFHADAGDHDLAALEHADVRGAGGDGVSGGVVGVGINESLLAGAVDLAQPVAAFLRLGEGVVAARATGLVVRPAKLDAELRPRRTTRTTR